MVDVSDDPRFLDLVGIKRGGATDEAISLLAQYSRENLIVALKKQETENRRLRGEVERLGAELRSRGLGHVVRGGER